MLDMQQNHVQKIVVKNVDQEAIPCYSAKFAIFVRILK